MNKKFDNFVVARTSEGPQKSWREIKMIEVAPWFGGEGIDYLYLVFKSTTGIIRGKIKIKGADEIYSFSSLPNTTLPIAVRNLWLPEKHHFRKLPTIQYKISEKTNINATLSIIMVAAHGVGEHGIISLEKPVEIQEH